MDQFHRQFAARALVAAVGFVLACHQSPSQALDLIGYVPSYRMGDAQYVNNVLPAQLAMLDEVRYFGISVTSSGGLTTSASNLAHLVTLQDKISELPPSQRPRLDITLGGAEMSANYATIAQNESLRAALAQNIAALLDQTGAVGVDVDWEHPSEGAQLTTHYPALLSRIKQELGPERRVYATVSPEKILPRAVFEGPHAIDGVSIMTYDIGWWANDPADPNLGEHSLQQYVADVTNAWTNPVGTSIPRTYVFGSKKSVDAPENKLGVGAPFYGRGYNGSSSGLAVAYKDLKARGTTTDGNAYVYQGSKVWLPGPTLVENRVEFAETRGLEHIIFWELWPDLSPNAPQSLLRTAFNTKVRLAAAEADFNADGAVNEADLAIWTQSFGISNAGDATGDGVVNGADFLVWQRWVTTASLAPTHSVPEPCSTASTLVSLFALWAAHRAQH